MWLGTNVVAYFGHDLCCEVSHFIVPDGWESSCVAVESMIHCKGLTTYAVLLGHPSPVLLGHPPQCMRRGAAMLAGLGPMRTCHAHAICAH